MPDQLKLRAFRLADDVAVSICMLTVGFPRDKIEDIFPIHCKVLSIPSFAKRNFLTKKSVRGIK